MIHEAALAIAGPGAHLVTRPGRTVHHVYVGPLTPAGYVPRRSRPVCRIPTRRLASVTERRTSLARVAGPRVCLRCSACLSRRRDRQAEPPCTTRAAVRARYAGMTWRDAWAQTVMAETLTELEQIAHVALVVLGHAACEQLLPVHHEGIDGRTLTELTGRRRERLAGNPHADRAEAARALVETGYAQAKAERHDLWKDREARIARFGFVNATT